MTIQENIILWIIVTALFVIDKPNITCLFILIMLVVAWNDIIKTICKSKS